MKRLFSFILVLGLLFAGCAPKAPAEDPAAAAPTLPPEELPSELPELPPLPEEAPMLFTDSAGREVSLPQPLLHLLPGNAEAQSFLFSLAAEYMAGWVSPPSDMAYVGEAYRALPSLATADGAPDWAAAKAAGAQAVLYMGSAMAPDQLDALQEQSGLPVVFIDSGMDMLADAFRTLGGLLGLEEAAGERAEYLAPAMDDLLAHVAAIPEESRKQVYYATGEDGLTAGALDFLSLSGASTPFEAGMQVTLEELGAFAPDAVITADPALYAGMGSDASWQELEFILMGLYYQAPVSPTNWLLDNTSAGHLMAAKWLFTLLYPENGYNMLEETRLYVDTFWHYQLTDEQAQALLETSIFKTIG